MAAIKAYRDPHFMTSKKPPAFYKDAVRLGASRSRPERCLSHRRPFEILRF